MRVLKIQYIDNQMISTILAFPYMYTITFHLAKISGNRYKIINERYTLHILIQ